MDSIKQFSCQQASDAMLQHMDKTISSQDAKSLVHHLGLCKTCKEEYLMLDQLMESADSYSVETLDVAPSGFTQLVMAKVIEPAPVVEMAKATDMSKVISLTIIAIMSAIALSAGAIMQFAYANPALEWVANAASYLAGLGSSFIDGVAQSPDILDGTIGIIALVFVLVLGSLLVILQQEEEKRLA